MTKAKKSKNNTIKNGGRKKNKSSFVESSAVAIEYESSKKSLTKTTNVTFYSNSEAVQGCNLEFTHRKIPSSLELNLCMFYSMLVSFQSPSLRIAFCGNLDPSVPENSLIYYRQYQLVAVRGTRTPIIDVSRTGLVAPVVPHEGYTNKHTHTYLEYLKVNNTYSNSDQIIKYKYHQLI